MYGSCRSNLLMDKVFGVIAGKQREVEDGICFGSELRGVSGEENDGRTPKTGFA